MLWVAREFKLYTDGIGVQRHRRNDQHGGEKQDLAWGMHLQDVLRGGFKCLSLRGYCRCRSERNRTSRRRTRSDRIARGGRLEILKKPSRIR